MEKRNHKPSSMPATIDLSALKTEIIAAVKDTLKGVARQETVSAVMERGRNEGRHDRALGAHAGYAPRTRRHAGRCALCPHHRDHADGFLCLSLPFAPGLQPPRLVLSLTRFPSR